MPCSGYDCSLRKCPSGDDPGTYEDHSEVQLLQCVADGGYFQLSFRQATTRPIYFNETANQVKSALQGLSTLPKVNVFFTNDGPIPAGVLNYLAPSKFGVPNQYISHNATITPGNSHSTFINLIYLIAH